MDKTVKRIGSKYLEAQNACSKGVKYWEKNGSPKTLKKCIEICINDGSEDPLNYANWLITKAMNNKQRVQYAIYAAEQVINIYEKSYPDDDRPRKAIEAAKNYLNNPKDKSAARAAAADAARAAAAAADAAWAADRAAARAADRAAAAAAEAAWAAAADAARAAAAAAAWAADRAADRAAAAAAAWAADRDAARAAAAAAAWAADRDAARAAAADDKKEMQIRILTYGLYLVYGGNL